jgi:hypothetical protein
MTNPLSDFRFRGRLTLPLSPLSTIGHGRRFLKDWTVKPALLYLVDKGVQMQAPNYHPGWNQLAKPPVPSVRRQTQYALRFTRVAGSDGPLCDWHHAFRYRREVIVGQVPAQRLV